MKLMVEDKKKQIIYIVVIVLCLGGTAWVWFGGGFSTGGSADVSSTAAVPNLAGGAAPASLVGSDKSVLPFGTKFDLSLFSDARFKELKDTESLRVAPEELGRYNPFIAPTSTPQ
jgi:hypothetical protein